MTGLETINDLSRRVAHASKSAWRRAYSDFLMPDRLDTYGTLIQSARDHGYCIHSIFSFWQLLKSKTVDLGDKYIILRHDVDDDPGSARRMWQLEVQLGVCSSSYYFRLSTADATLMRDIAQSGQEVSYHYEELSSMAREAGFTSKEEVYAAMPQIRDLFRHNLAHLRESTGLPMRTVAAHGDFVNRRLGIPNQVILAEAELRHEMDIELEAYDRTFLGEMTAEHSDERYPQVWLYADPGTSIRDGKPVLHIIVHPQNWHSSIRVTMPADAERIWQGLAYRWAAHSRRNRQ